jgi:tripartite-type tricarboxylate transporter receptor subunit TctC
MKEWLMRYRLVTFLGMVFAGLCSAVPVLGSEYPDRPITLYTMVQPGAQIDLLTRGIAKRLNAELGQPVTVRNAPGGSHGSVMAAELSRAAPDGYTLGIGATTAYTYAPHHVKTAYSFDDFEYVTLVALNSSGYVARADRPWKTLKDAFAWAKKENKALIYNFHGTDDRDALQRIAKAEAVPISLMPSKGGPSVIQAVTGGHADIGYLGAILYDHVKAGRLKLLASALSQRLPPIPDVPTLQEQGWDETVEMYVMMVAPKGIPADRMAKVEKVMAKLAADKETQTFITEKLLMLPVKWGKEHAGTYMKSAYERFGKEARASAR